MTNPTKALVDIPAGKGIYIKSAGEKGEKYVYRYIEYIRNEQGQCRNKSKIIGKVDVATGKMIPNRTFFEMFSILPEYSELKISSYGYTYVVFKSCQDMGLFNCLNEVFGSQTTQIISTAAYIIRHGNDLDEIDKFQAENFIKGLNRSLTALSCCKMFEKITPDKMSDFFGKWVDITFKKSAILYDIESVSSYVDEMSSLERGYNPNYDDLSQFNLGMLRCEISKLPLYYRSYQGSLTEKANLHALLADAKSLGIKKVKLVLDSALSTEEQFRRLRKLSKNFTIGVPIVNDFPVKLIEAYLSQIKNEAYQLGKKKIFCLQKKATVSGLSGKLMLFFDQENQTKLRKDFTDRLEQLAAELAKLKRYPLETINRYDNYFKITKHEPGPGFDFELDQALIHKLMERQGFFLLFTNDLAASPEELLALFKTKDADEKQFTQIRADLEGQRILPYNESLREGRIFVTFIALIIKSYMIRKLNKVLTRKSMPFKRVLNELQDIKIANNISSGTYRFTKALTNQQRSILRPFKAVDSIITSIDSFVFR
ncbi:MAG: hypothetical protein LBE80_10370 [Deltaproteobacteria bacterium]|nr:hypothetical protein [Deltaproteobacteria bacterium]